MVFAQRAQGTSFSFTSADGGGADDTRLLRLLERLPLSPRLLFDPSLFVSLPITPAGCTLAGAAAAGFTEGSSAAVVAGVGATAAAAAENFRAAASSITCHGTKGIPCSAGHSW